MAIDWKTVNQFEREILSPDIVSASATNETACMVLLHKDNMKNNLTKSKKHKLYKGIPDYHIQKR